MSLDKSLKNKAGLARHRNVLTRTERIEVLKEEGRWTDETSPIGLPKIVHRKLAVGAKDKKEAKTDEEGEGGGEEAKKD